MKSQDSLHPVAASIVPRPRLLALLQRAPVPPIVLIVAPAGFGKSTLASQWLQSRSSLTVYLSLTSEHNTPDRFLRALSAAFGCSPVEASTLDSLLDLIAKRGETSPDGIVVVDDYHLIENPEVHQMMSVLINSMPAGMQLLIVSRTIPPLPLARRRMNGDVLELSMAELSFTKDEIAELLASDSSASLLSMDAEELASRTDGWIAGIRLAMVSAQAQGHSGAAPGADPLNLHRSLDEFVIEEILATLPATLEKFILCTAFLPYLDPDLCDYVLQSDDSSALIAEASQKLAFIRFQNGGSSPLTYHALFAESANRISDRIYSPADRRSRYIRAAEWLEQHGMWEEALEQAIMAQDWDAAFRYVRIVCGELRERDLSASRLYWLRKLPLKRLTEHHDLTRWLTSALLESGHVTEANQVLDQVMPIWQSSSAPQLLAYFHGTSTFLSTLQGDDGAASRHLYTWLGYQRMDDYVERLHAWAAVMLQEFHRGNDVVSHQAYLQVQHCRQHLPREQGWMFNHVELGKTNQLAHRGDLMGSVTRYQSQIERLPAVFQHSKPNIQARIAALYLEQHQLDAALAMVREVERGLDAFPQQLWHTEAWLIVARVHHALNDRSSAQEAINRARLIQEQGGGWTLLLKIMATEAWLLFEDRGDAPLVDSSLGIDLHKPWRTAFVGELDPRLVEIARLVLQGHASAVTEPLQKLIDDAINTKRWAEIVRLATWQVVTRLETGDKTGAIEALKLALHHGRPGGFVRSFYTPGYDLAPFLRGVQAQLQDVDASYVDNLILSGLWPTTTTTFLDTDSRTEDSPLTQREHDVLELLVIGLSNKEIGEQLFITERTAKKHVSNIMQKLDAANRTYAVARARKLNLIS